MEGSLHLTATIPVPGLLHMKGEEITLYLGDDVFHDCSNIGLRCVTHQEDGEVYSLLTNCNKTCSTRVTLYPRGLRSCWSPLVLDLSLGLDLGECELYLL